MDSRQISYHVTGRDNERYVFLDKNPDNSYSVRSGTSVPQSHLSWEENFVIETVKDFLASNPQHRAKIEELIAEFESETL